MIAGAMEVVDLEHLDFAHDASCEHFKGCGREATWLGVKACCRAGNKYLCDEHKARQRRLTRGARMRCKDCGFVFEDAASGVEWTPIQAPQDAPRR